MGKVRKFQCSNCKHVVENDFDESTVICGHCDSLCTMPEEIGPGAVIDEYLIVDLLGQGGMGNVYLAHEFSLDRKVALKILKDDFMSNPEHKSEFIYEARSVASLNHPNIIQAHKVGEENGIVYFVSEYVEGQTLKDILQKEGPLSLKGLLSISIEVVSALGYAWNLRKLVHRDIKPENIMLNKAGTAKLMDLGLSVRDGCEVDEGEQIKGTPQYISPEQILGGVIDNRTDFYCLGATLYHLISGQIPFQGSLQEIVKGHVSGRPRSLKNLVPGIDERFAKIIHKLMAKEPEKRYQSADALLSSLNKLKTAIEDEEHGKKHFKLNSSFETKISIPSSDLIKARKKNPLKMATLVMLLVLGGVFFLLVLFKGKPDNFKNTAKKTDSSKKEKSASKVELPVKTNMDLILLKNITPQTIESAAVEIDLSQCGVNDSDVEYAFAELPENGTLSGKAPKITYKPNPLFSGTDKFSFHVKKGDESLSAAPVEVLISVKRKGLAINCGGKKYKSKNGLIFLEDCFHNKGSVYARGNREVEKTDDDTVFSSERYGNFTYDIPLSGGEYLVTLMFSENHLKKTGQRLFDVSIEGKAVLSKFDIFKEAGGMKKALIKSFKTMVKDNKLTIQFKSITNSANILGIIVEPVDEAEKQTSLNNSNKPDIPVNNIVNSTCVIYEGFSSDSPELVKMKSAAGLSGSWSDSEFFLYRSGSLSYGSIPASGGKVEYSNTGKGSCKVSLSDELKKSGLLKDGATLWFSMILKTPDEGGTNADTGFALGNGAIEGGNLLPMEKIENEGVGFTITQDALRSTFWKGEKLASEGVGIPCSKIILVVGEIIWGKDSKSSDTLRIYLPKEDLKLGQALTEKSSVVDQSEFNTLSFGSKRNIFSFDEIRFGSTYNSVIGRQ